MSYYIKKEKNYVSVNMWLEIKNEMFYYKKSIIKLKYKKCLVIIF